MSRGLAAGVLTEILKQTVTPIILAQAEFTSGVTRVWSGMGSLSWDSQTWIGLGGLLTFSTIAESSDVRADGVEISLSGISANHLTSALSEVRQGKPAKIYVGFMNEAGAVIADPYLAFSGRIDTCAVDENISADGEATCTITITVENRLIDFQRSRERRYTHQDQQTDYAGDLGFQFVEAIQDWNGQSGSPGPGVPAGGRGRDGINPGGDRPLLLD